MLRSARIFTNVFKPKSINACRTLCAASEGYNFQSVLRDLKASEHFDLIVIGSGPAAQKCAIDSAKKGKKVAIVDKKDMMGGVCVHTGTIPSKVCVEEVLYCYFLTS